MEQNPYEPPRTEHSPVFVESAPGMADLERRVQELEKRVSKSWFLAPHFLRRVLAVWAYFLIGYVIIAAAAFPFMLFWEWFFNERLLR